MLGYRFSYANGVYHIGTNGCACEDLTGGSDKNAEPTACKCAFPVEGEPVKGGRVMRMGKRRGGDMEFGMVGVDEGIASDGDGSGGEKKHWWDW